MTAPTHDKPLRADAPRNREKLLAAAVELFAERGTEGSLEEVAKRAGVGIGTLYRHFPTRDALVEAAYRNEVAQLRAAADELLAELPPDEALEAFMRRFIEYGTAKRGMRDALQSIAGGGPALFAETRARSPSPSRCCCGPGRRRARCAPTSRPRTSCARWARSGWSPTATSSRAGDAHPAPRARRGPLPRLSAPSRSPPAGRLRAPCG